MGTFDICLEKSVREEDASRSCNWAVFQKVKELGKTIESGERKVSFYRTHIIELMSKVLSLGKEK